MSYIIKKLTIKDRLILLSILPAKGSLIVMMHVKNLIDKLSFDDKELEEYKIRQENSFVTWDNDEEYYKEVQFNSEEIEILKKQIKQKDEAQEILFEMIETFNKIINN